MVKISLDIFSKVLIKALKPGDEKVFLVGDEGIGPNKASVFLTQGFSMACEELGLDYETWYQSTKARGENADPILIKKLKTLPRGSIAMINVSNRLGSMHSLGHSFRNYMHRQNHRFTSASSLGTIAPENMSVLLSALNTDYLAASRRNAIIKKAFDNGREVELRTKAGTDVVFDISGMTARNNDGAYHLPGTGGNLPGSECYIAPCGKGVNGTIVIDGSSRVLNGTRLVRSPIKMSIENGSIVAMNRSPDAKELDKTLKWAEYKSEHSWGVRRVGELGVGTNRNAKLIGSMIVDEKVFGTAHIALGSNKWFGGSITSITHLDQVMNKPTIKVDGKFLRF